EATGVSDRQPARRCGRGAGRNGNCPGVPRTGVEAGRRGRPAGEASGRALSEAAAGTTPDPTSIIALAERLHELEPAMPLRDRPDNVLKPTPRSRPHMFDVEACRAQFPGLAREVNGRPAVFLDGPAGSQVPRR